MTRAVTLICGPPCSGKTTLAAQLAKPEDFILDPDRIAARVTASRRWHHLPMAVDRVERIYRDTVAQLAVTGDITAYVVACLPDPVSRREFAARVGATAVHVVVPLRQTCVDRARLSNRPVSTLVAIDRWYRVYRPDPGDTPPPEVTRRRARPATPGPHRTAPVPQFSAPAAD